jgi:hypothetical protein
MTLEKGKHIKVFGSKFLGSSILYMQSPTEGGGFG